MITAGQMRAARALLGIDQRRLAELSGLSLPTIQRMEASEGVIRGNVDSLMKLVGALDDAGIELIDDGARQPRRRPRRAPQGVGRLMHVPLLPACVLLAVAALLATGLAGAIRARARDGRILEGRILVYGACLALCTLLALAGLAALVAPPAGLILPLGLPWIGAHFRLDRAGRILPVRGQSRRRRRQPVRPRLRPARGRAGAGAAVLPGLPRRA